ncbi:MAG: histidine kinase [Bacteroidota bacterium]
MQYSVAQDFQYRHYTIDDGLPSSEVYDLLQDQQGYIWISTDNGVCRFDGYEFKHFQREQGLKDHVVFHLREDHSARIWMSTISNHIYIYDGDSIYPYAHNALIQQFGAPFRGTRAFYVDTLNNLHLAYSNLGVLKVEEDGRYQIYKDSSYAHFFLYRIEDHLLSTYTPKHFSKKKQMVDAIPMYTGMSKKQLAIPAAAINRSPSWSAFHLDEHYDLVVAGKAYYLFKDDQLDTTFIGRPNLDNLCVTNDGEILLGFSKQVGALYFPSIQAFRQYNGFPVLKNYTVSHILSDQRGGLWFATIEDGIFYVPNPESRIYDSTTALPNENCKALTTKDGKRPIVGLSTGEVCALQPFETAVILYHRDDAIFDLQYDTRNQVLWHASSMKDRKSPLAIISSSLQPRIRHSLASSLSLNARKLSFSPDSGRMYGCIVGHNGFFQIDLQSTQNEILVQRAAYSEGWTQDVLEDYEGRLWVGRNNGLHEYKNKKLSFVSVGYEAPETRVEELELLTDSTIVIGTKGLGVVLWKGEVFTIINEQNGLIANEVETIYIDQAENIWVGTLAGLSKITRKRNQAFSIQSFSTFDGLASNEINDLLQIGDRIWVATKKGLTYLPLYPKTDTTTIPPIIDQVLVNNESVSDLAQLHYQANNITIQFKSLDYQQNAKIRYRYRLKDQADWQISLSPKVSLLQLTAGNYQFEVQAQNRAGFWSASRYLHFRIQPPFWQQYWFKILLFLAAVFLVYWIIQRRTKNLSKALQIEQELSELKQLALQSQMNPHFIFNCLNAIQGFVAKGDRMNGTLYLSKFSSLVRAVLQVSTQKQITLEEEIKILNDYLELEKMRFEGQLSYELEVADHIDLFETLLPPLIIQPIVENAIIHAFSDQTKTASIRISFEQIGKRLQITVEDNGKGFQQSTKHSIFQTNHQSFGLELTRRRLALFSSLGADQSLQIENIKDKKEMVIGAKVTLWVESV